MEDRFVVERSAEYSVSPQYRPSVTESHLSKYVLEVDPLAFDKDRASFSYRSPGLGVIQNSTIELAFDLRLSSRVPITYVGQMGPQIQILQNNATQELLSQAGNNAFDVRAANTAALPSSKLAFGSGDAMQKCISSLQVVVNGAAIAQTRQRDYMRSLQKCWFDKDVFQKRYAQCGGTPQQYDAVAVSGETLQNIDGNAAGLVASVLPYTGAQNTLTVAGFTGDSGIRDRLKNVLGCIKSAPVGDATHAIRDIRVRWRISGTGLFNPLSRGDKVASSCPYKQSARALPHMNVVSINIMFQDLFKTLIRNFSTSIAVAGTVGAQDFAEGGDNSVAVSFPGGDPKAKLYVEYLRLPSWRAQSGTALLQTYRVAIHDPTSVTNTDVATVPVTAVDKTTAITNCLKPTGIDRYQGNAAPWRESGKGINGMGQSYRECQWNGITAAQIPQYLFVVLEKSSDMFCNSTRFVTAAQIINTVGGGPAIDNLPSFAVGDVGADMTTGSGNASRKCQLLARNSDGNAAITQFHLEIMSVQGSYIYSSEDWPFLKTRGDLYRDVQKYCIDSYDDQDTWFKHNCIVLLGAAEFAKGISSPGAAFPCTFTVKARFENWRQFVDGHGCSYLIGNGLGAAQDIIEGRPVLGMIYPQQSLQVSASSALLSSQNISHSSAMELLSRQ